MNTQWAIRKADHLRNVEGKLQEAIELLKNSLIKVPPDEKPAILNKLANLYLDVGKTDKSIKTFKKAVVLARKTKNELVEADALRKLGYVVWKTEKNDKKAIELAKKSLKIIKKRPKDKKFQKVGASAWATIGNVQSDKGNLQRAFNSYQQSLKLARISSYKERVVTILGDIGNIYLAQRKFAQAEKYFLKAEKSARKYYRHALPAALLRLGYTFFDSKNPERNLIKAEDYFYQSLEIALKEGWKREQADAYFTLGRLAIEKGQSQNAKNNFKKAIAIYQKIKMPSLANLIKSELKKLSQG